MDSAYATRPSDLASSTINQASQAAVPPLPPVQAAAPPPPAPDMSGAPDPAALPDSIVKVQAPAFDPNQPFTKGDAPAFDPNKPFETPEEGPTSTTGKIIDGASRVLDYPGGFARRGVAEGVGAAIGKDLTRPEDDDNILKGKGPNTAEYMKRAGISEGINGDLPIVGHISQRGIEGFIGDVVSDPITLFGKAAKLIPGVPEALNKLAGAAGLGADAAAKKIGEYIYKTGFNAIDAKMVEKGGEPLSELLLQEAKTPAGTTNQVAQKVQKVADTMGKMRDGLYQTATDLGVTIDVGGGTLPKAEAVIERLKRDPNLAKQAEAMEEFINNHKAAGPVDIGRVSEWKTNLYNSLPDSFKKGTGGLTDIGKQFKAALASDYKDLIVQAGNKAKPGLGDSIEAINNKWGTLLDANKPMAQQIKQAAGKPLVSPLKAVVTAHNPALGAVMEAADLAKTTAVKTHAGRAIRNAGRSGVAGDLARHGVINGQQDDTTDPEE